MSGQQPNNGGPGGFNPGAFEFRPGQQQAFVPRGQQPPPAQQGGYDPYAQYQQQPPQQGYYPQYGYPQYGQPQQQQQPYYPGQQAYAPPPPQQRTFQPRQVQGFQPPSFESSPAPSPPPGKVSGGKPVSLSIGGGGAPKAAPSLSIGGGAPKAAPSLSIGGGGAPKAAPSLSIGGAKAAPSLSIGGAKAAPSLSIGKKEDKATTEKKEEKKADKEETSAQEIDDEFAPSAASTGSAAASAPTTDVAPSEPNPSLAPASASGPPATDAQVTVAKGSDSTDAAPPTTTGTHTASTNFSKVSAKNDAEAILREQAANADAMKDLYGEGADAVDPNVKSHLNIILVGHVDSGKSTTGGQLLFLNGAVDKRTMEKYEQEAKAAGRETWYLSYALDSNKEERAQGKTIEVGRAIFETEKRRYTILDAPGHKSFVPSMISGAAQADLALLVLSARKGEFETGFERDGQTREHAMLVKNNGINKLVLVVNKMDDQTVGWDQERFMEIQKKITPFLKSVGFNPKTDLTFIPVSAQKGENMKVKVDKKVAPWYEGPSLLEYLDNVQIMDRDINAPFMLPVAEKYNELGSMVMGKIESGRVKKGAQLLMMPNKVTVEVVGIFTEQAEEIEQAFCGDNIRLRIRGVNDEDIQPGYVISSVQKPIKAVTAFKADLSIIEVKNIICGGYSCVLHVHTLAEEVTLTALLAYYDKKTKRKSKKPPQFGKVGMMVSVLIETAAPICIETWADYKMLGRFTLRDEGKTIAIGKVTKLYERAEDIPNVAGLNLGA